MLKENAAGGGYLDIIVCYYSPLVMGIGSKEEMERMQTQYMKDVDSDSEGVYGSAELHLNVACR